MNRTIAGILAIGLGLAVLYWAVIMRPQQAAADASRSRAGEVVAAAQAGAAEDTIRIITEHHNETDRITHRTVETTNEILTAPGADAPLDPALNAAGLRALCLHDGRAPDPGCASVLHRDGEVGGAR